MGKGDKKSRRGKIILGSSGVRRPAKARKTLVSKEITVTSERIRRKTPKVADNEKPRKQLKPDAATDFTEEIAAEVVKSSKKSAKKVNIEPES